MRVCVVDNIHLYKDDEGKYFSSSIYDNQFISRFSNVYSEVVILGKTNVNYKGSLENFNEINDNKLTIVELPWFRGIKGMLLKLFKLLTTIRKGTKNADVYIFRVAQAESFFAYILRRNRSAPIILEIVNDPDTYFKGPMKWFSNFMMRRMLKNADGISYITKKVLQEKYPPNKNKKNAVIESYLTLDLDDSVISEPKKYEKTEDKFKLIHVANNIDGDNKGHRTVIDTVKYIRNKGYNVSVSFVGDGTRVREFKEYSQKLKVDKYVVFKGKISNKNDVYKELNEHDMFIFPTQFEGLGRVVIEAKACGLPVLSSQIGGVIELIDGKYLFDPLDYVSFGNEIIRLINNPKELEEMSVSNINSSKMYVSSINSPKRERFYKLISKRVNVKKRI